MNDLINQHRDEIAQLKRRVETANSLFERANKRAETAEQRAEIAERELKGNEARIDAWKKEIDEMRETQFRRFNNEECWIYQGDGEDYPESLICPVVISAQQLREFIAAEQRVKELERLLRYAEEQQLLPQMSFEGARELVSEIQKDATDAGGCYEVSTNLLDQLFERYTDRGACVLLNKFAIEKQLSIMKAVDTTYMAHDKGGEPISFYSAFLIVL